MAKISLNMIEKMMDPNIIDYYIINCAIPSIITIKNRYQIDFGKPAHFYNDQNIKLFIHKTHIHVSIYLFRLTKG